MLTGDENIVDIDFTVFWVIEQRRRLSVQHADPDGHGEGRRRKARCARWSADPNIQHLLTQARQITESEVPDAAAKDPRRVRRRHHDRRRCSCSRSIRRPRSSPSFRDVQAAQADQERLQNEAQTLRQQGGAGGDAARPRRSPRRRAPTATGSSPRRKGQAEALQQASTRATRPRRQVTRRAHVSGDDGTGLGARTRSSRREERRQRRGSLSAARCADARAGVAVDVIVVDVVLIAVDVDQPDETPVVSAGFGGVDRRRSSVAWPVLYFSVFVVSQTQQALVLRFGQVVAPIGRPLAPVIEPGLYYKLPLIDNVVLLREAHARPRFAAAGDHRVRPEAAGGRCVRALPHRRPAAVLPGARHTPDRPTAAGGRPQFGGAARARRRELRQIWCATSARR